MIAYFVTEIEVSGGRAVSGKDLRQLKKWRHNQGDVSAVEGIPPP